MFRKISFAIITAIALGAAAMSPASAGGKSGHGHGGHHALAMVGTVMGITTMVTATSTAARPSTSAAIATNTFRPGAACVS